MRDSVFLYGFVGLMALNLAVSFLYTVGMQGMYATVRRTIQTYRKKAR